MDVLLQIRLALLSLSIISTEPKSGGASSSHLSVKEWVRCGWIRGGAAPCGCTCTALANSRTVGLSLFITALRTEKEQKVQTDPHFRVSLVILGSTHTYC